MIIESYYRNKISNSEYKLPAPYYKAVELGLTNLDGWQFILKENVFGSLFDTIYEFNKPFIFLPFARRLDNDDVACFGISYLNFPVNCVAVVHLYVKPDFNSNYPTRKKPDFDTFWDWFRDAIEEVIERYP